MTVTAVIALFVFFVCIAALAVLLGQRHCRRTAADGRRAGKYWLGGRRGRG
jgi:hypothetical protein